MQSSDLVLTPETRLVLATAGGASSTALDAVPRSGIRWDAVVQVAMHERGVSGVWGTLREYPGVSVPPEVAATFERLALGSRMRMTWLAHRLDETVRAFGAAGIPVMLLKGAALGQTVYRSLAERQMGDLDLLVPDDKVAEARRVALEVGWRTTERELEQAFYASHHHLPPMRDGRAEDLHLEIHTQLLPEGSPFEFSASSVWQRARYLDAAHAAVPSAVDQVLHVGIHFAWGHMMTQGAWQAFRDLYQVSRQPGFDWHAVVERARQVGAVSATYWTLAMARAAAGVPVPGSVLTSLRPRRNGMILASLGRHLGALMDPLALPCPSTSLSGRLWLSAMKGDIGGRAIITPWGREHLNFVVLPRPASTHHAGMGGYLRRLGRSLGYLSTLVQGQRAGIRRTH